MPTIKCVGGIRDGDVIWVRDDCRDISLRESPPKISVSAIVNFDEIVEIKQEHYTKRVIMGPDGLIIEYLAPTNWTDEQAIKHQFGK